MALVIINDDLEVTGQVTVNRFLVEDENRIAVKGVLQTKKYIEEINDIKTEKFHIKGVNVFQESFGSEDENIVYAFDAEDMELLL